LFWAILIFAFLTLGAMAFAVAPIIRAKKKGSAVLVAAIALFILGIGCGTYLMLGQPQLAIRNLADADRGQINALIPPLIERTRQAPGDLRAWTYLGRVYLAAGDADDAAKAFARAVTLARLNKTPSAALYSAYGEALLKSGNGDEAAAAFNAALALDPKNAAARYYLAVPNIQAMVDGLAARLKQNPDDAEGWQQLIRAYAVLGEKEKALAALASARKFVPSSRAAFDAEAAELKLR
jgi:cytochrome c-type biogenesis protein CcmH